MSVKSREELLAAINTRFGEQTDDDTISFLEDITDTLTDLETRASDSTNWRTKYEENDADWRKRYTERFYSSDPSTAEPTSPVGSIDESKKPKTFADLFTTN